MALFERLAVLLRADAHGMVDALEDDRLLLRQHLRDAEAALAGKKARLEALHAEARDSGRAAERLNQRRADLERDVELALDEQRDDLARFAIQQLLPIRDQLNALAERDRNLNQEIAELTTLVSEQGNQLEDLRLRVRAVADQGSEEDVDPWRLGADDFYTSGRRITDEDVELELLRRRSGRAAESLAADAALEEDP